MSLSLVKETGASALVDKVMMNIMMLFSSCVLDFLEERRGCRARWGGWLIAGMIHFPIALYTSCVEGFLSSLIMLIGLHSKWNVG